MKSPITKLLKKSDSLLQALVRAKSPLCEVCGSKCQVGHHWIEKSRSSYLRYNLANLVALCHSCHSKIHNVFGNSVVGGLNVAEIIIKKRGRAWKNRMDRLQPKYQKVDTIWLEKIKTRLEKELSLISTS